MKTTLITGAAKRVGREIAMHLSEKGWYVWIHYHTGGDDALSLAEEIRKKGGSASCVQADLTKADEMDGMFDLIRRSETGLDLMVNNAAVFFDKPLQEMTFNEWDQVFDVNLKAVWYCTKKAAELMRLGGCVINMADANAEKMWSRHAAYCISKSALKNLTVSCAKAFAPDIRVNSISPGFILRDSDTSPENWKKLVEKSLLGRGGNTADILRTVDYILETDSLTGADLIVDGGSRYSA